ncbi:MAG: carboxylesterase [Desulfofustis sp.]|nr:carboxylesterase [Desulfofustis sp.]
MSLLPAIERQTNENPDSTVIWLHGLGADGNDFAPIIPQLRLPQEMGIRFIFPHAPEIPVTVNGGFVMRAWYDIIEMQIDRRVDVKQLLKSAEEITAYIDHEIARGIKKERIVIAGFSQGGAVAYQAVLSRSDALGGLLAMSTYFATWDSIDLAEGTKKIPMEVHHGLYDPVVPEHLGQKAVAELEEHGYKPVYRTYPMEHGVCPEQIDDISDWLQSTLRN